MRELFLTRDANSSRRLRTQGHNYADKKHLLSLDAVLLVHKNVKKLLTVCFLFMTDEFM